MESTCKKQDPPLPLSPRSRPATQWFHFHTLKPLPPPTPILSQIHFPLTGGKQGKSLVVRLQFRPRLPGNVIRVLRVSKACGRTRKKRGKARRGLAFSSSGPSGMLLPIPAVLRRGTRSEKSGEEAGMMCHVMWGTCRDAGIAQQSQEHGVIGGLRRRWGAQARSGGGGLGGIEFRYLRWLGKDTYRD